jgi:ribosomal protein S18 acetylase RimI-like enzyme
LTNPIARTFVVLRLDEGHAISVNVLEEENKDDGEHGEEWFNLVKSAHWVGSLVLLGPRLDQGEFPTANQSPMAFFNKSFTVGKGPDSLDDRGFGDRTFLFAINAVHVSPRSRGNKLGKRLIEAANEATVDAVAAMKRETDKITCVVFVEKENPVAIRLYRSTGFEVVGEEAYVNAYGKSGRVWEFQRITLLS